jgi:hypothetical protein
MSTVSVPLSYWKIDHELDGASDVGRHGRRSVLVPAMIGVEHNHGAAVDFDSGV